MTKTKRWTSKRDVLKVLPERKPESHKGDFGRLLIVGGGSHYVGAPALVGLAALRSGADLVIVAAPEKTAWAVNSISPDLITLKLPCKDLEPSVIPELRSELERSTAVVVGPGLGTTSKTLDAVIEIARELKEKHPRLPTLFDADGLKALANTRDLLHGMPWILTPHVGEFKLLIGRDIPRSMD
ncbi:MAG: NAD(P)H-hydrate dehydratase, partial [Hadesarchaea archaeon]